MKEQFKIMKIELSIKCLVSAPSQSPSCTRAHVDRHGAGFLCTVFLNVLCAFLTAHCSISQEVDLPLLVFNGPKFIV